MTKRLWTTFFTLLLLGPLSEISLAAKSASNKAFAVFAYSYNEKNDLIVGGVSGTAFFVSETIGVTAFHVLQPKTFKPNPGFQHRKVFLIFENSEPIEIFPDEVTHFPSRDQSIIRLRAGRKVPRRHVFQLETSVKPEARVESEGFVANTSGPVLVRKGKHVKIAKVPSLERRRLRGMVLRQAPVEMRADDVHMKGVNCVQLSYTPIVGFSGGPVISVRGRVIAMNSFAEPATRAQTWAVSLTRQTGIRLF